MIDYDHFIHTAWISNKIGHKCGGCYSKCGVECAMSDIQWPLI